MPKRTEISSILIGCGLVSCAPEPEGGEQVSRILLVRLAQVDEVSPQLKEADPDGSIWAQRHDENFPARIARECGVGRFSVLHGSESFLAVEIPLPQPDQALVQCLTTRGGGYLRLSTSSAESQ